MESEKVKEIKKALEDHSIEKLKYQDGIKIKEIDFIDILTLINELESENNELKKYRCDWLNSEKMHLQADLEDTEFELGCANNSLKKVIEENQQLKDRIENQRMTKKGFRYEILPSTENSPRRVKDYNEYCTLYNRLAELEDKIDNGTLVEFPFCVFDKKKNKEANCYKIALKEDWAKCLCYCDMEGFAITQDGMLILLDECGEYTYCPDNRFKVVAEAR